MNRRDYIKGEKYRVVRAGAYLRGMTTVGRGVFNGWRRDLQVGDVITCLGESWTMGDGVPAIKWGDETGEWLANDCTFQPCGGGLWGGQVPLPGYLEPADDEDEALDHIPARKVVG